MSIPKPGLSILEGDDWRRAIEAEEAAQEAGGLFRFPELEKHLAAGEELEIFDRTNAVFQLSLRQAHGGDGKGETVDFVPRSMFILAGLHDLESKLAGTFDDRQTSVLTGAPGEHDGLEYHLSISSSTVVITTQGEDFVFNLTGVDYDASIEQMMSPDYDRTNPPPKPRLDESFRAPTLKGAYVAAAHFGEQAYAKKLADRNLEGKPLRSPALSPPGVEIGPRSRTSGLAEPEL